MNTVNLKSVVVATAYAAVYTYTRLQLLKLEIWNLKKKNINKKCVKLHFLNVQYYKWYTYIRRFTETVQYRNISFTSMDGDIMRLNY